MVKTLLIQLEICGTTNWIVLNEKKNLHLGVEKS